jgi:hypothetical protein
MKMKSQKPPLVRLMKLVRGQPLRKWELRINEGLLSREGTVRLAATMMAEALLDIYHRGSRKHGQAALAWVMSPANGYVFAFKTLCDQFDIDEETMRADIVSDVRQGKAKSKVEAPC